MCGSMVDIQSPTTEIRRGKKRRRRNQIMKIYMACPITRGGHKWYAHFMKVFCMSHSGECFPLYWLVYTPLLNLVNGTKEQQHKTEVINMEEGLCVLKLVIDTGHSESTTKYTVSQKNVPPLQLAIIFTYTVRLRQFLAQMLLRK